MPTVIPASRAYAWIDAAWSGWSRKFQVVSVNFRFSAPAADRRVLRELQVLPPLLDRRIGRRELLPERAVVADEAVPEHHPRQLLRAVDRQCERTTDPGVLEHREIGPHAGLSVRRDRLRVVDVLRVVLEHLRFLRRQLHAQVDLPASKREHEWSRAREERQLHSVERRTAAPVRVVPDELRTLLLRVALELERARSDHAALDPRTRIGGDRGRLDDRLVRRLAQQVRERAERRLQPEADGVPAAAETPAASKNGARPAFDPLPTYCFIEATTSADVISLPLWKRTPLRSWNVQTVASLFGFQVVASVGRTCAWGLVNVRYSPGMPEKASAPPSFRR